MEDLTEAMKIVVRKIDVWPGTGTWENPNVNPEYDSLNHKFRYFYETENFM